MRKMFFIFLAAFMLCAGSTTSSAAIVVPAANATEPDATTVRAAFRALVDLSKKARKEKFKLAKKAIRDFKAAKKAGEAPDTNTLLLAILAILLPPLAVYLHQGETNNKFWITLLLFVLGLAGAFFFSWLLIFAAIVYALIIVLGGA
jgi:uncharacterized membrane protein YqaE (UPF0057 family)